MGNGWEKAKNQSTTRFACTAQVAGVSVSEWSLSRIGVGGKGEGLEGTSPVLTMLVMFEPGQTTSTVPASNGTSQEKEINVCHAQNVGVNGMVRR